MYRIARPKKDTTIYSDQPCKNTGLDEILELMTFAEDLPKSPDCDPSYLSESVNKEFDPDFGYDRFTNDFIYNYRKTFEHYAEYLGFLDFDSGDRLEDLTTSEAKEIMEIVIEDFYPPIKRFGKEFETLRAQKSRILLYFKVEEWIQKIKDLKDVESGEDPPDYDVFLRLWATESRELPLDYNIDIHPLEGRFSYFLVHTSLEGFGTGLGRKFNKSEVGASWLFQDVSSQERWGQPGGDFPDGRLNGEVVKDTQRFDFESPDLFTSVKNTFEYWLDNGNEGMVVKRSNIDEKMKGGIYQAIENLGAPSELKFFSTMTHTIYAPELLLAIDDHEWYTDAGEFIAFADSLDVVATNLSDEYTNEESPRIRVAVEEMFPDKVYLEDEDAVAQRRTPKYLPEGSVMYSIVDDVADKTIIPFTKYSQLSFDPDGYYFDIDMTNFYPERVYEIRFKYIDPVDGYSKVYKNKQKFKVIK